MAQAAGEPNQPSSPLYNFPKVSIDDGIQKYVLLKASYRTDDGSLPLEQYYVRGRCAAEFHVECATVPIQEMESQGISVDIKGGGRINHNASAKTIRIYGYSMQFGRAEHLLTSKLCQEAFPDHQVEWSNEGY